MMAALTVVITHSTFYASERLDKNFHFWARGATGVDIFFVLSGFVMAYSSAALIKSRDGWKIFVERRLARIVPMYWLATSLKLGAMLLTAGFVMHAHLSLEKTIYSYLFLPTRNIDGEIRPLLGVGWTLNFEMFFYFIFALALLTRQNVYWFVGLILTPLALASFLRMPDWPVAAFYLDSQVCEFFLGMLIAKFTLSEKYLPRMVAIPAFLAGYLLLLIGSPGPLRWMGGGIAAAMIVCSAVALEENLTWIPKWVLFLGDASYVIYLFHPMIAPAAAAILAKIHLPNPWISVCCSVVLGFGAGALIHQFVELPVMKAMRGVLSPRHGRWLAEGTEVSLQNRFKSSPDHKY